MLDISVGAAFLAGLLSFVSPCVLPIVPPYLCYLAGVSVEELKGEAATTATSRRIIFSSIAFVLGFATVFVALGATASVIGQTIAQYFDTLAIVAGAIIIVMGLHFLGVFRIGLLFREARVQVQRKPAGLVGAYIIGLAFAFGWTPCVGPVLAAILFMAGTTNPAQGSLLLLVYALGIGLPFILAAAFASQFLGWAGRFRKHMGTVEKIMGGFLILTGILFITGKMSEISYWLLETFPAFSQVG
ncbi:cytochrome c biogenesis CcdA family protein [Roseibium aggregatum]|uniref:Cytochrome c biogenesis protein CcdA n=1 Tax=Roseibium aggregatum TaxID=187304 RepID=A0A926NV56_9HYPH|nr:cytochrome c biogenesis protein CcdA [Roseibium aggregatum]MBD1544981.1 cytochrome c biogenesis protein CcdA [Roseibium aggregatum]